MLIGKTLDPQLRKDKALIEELRRDLPARQVVATSLIIRAAFAALFSWN